MPKNNKDNSHNNSHTHVLVKRLIRDYVSVYWGRIILSVFFMAIAGAMSAAIAGLMEPIFDDVFTAENKDLVLPVAAAVTLVFTVRGLATYIHTILMNKVGNSIVADVQRDLFKRTMQLDMSFFHANSSGELLSYVVNDVNVMRNGITGTLTGIGKSFFTLIFLVGVMFYQDWKLALVTFVVFPLISVLVLYIGRRLRKISKNIQEEMGSLSSLLSQSYQGIRLVKSYVMEDHEINKVSGAIDKVRDLNIKSVKVSTLATPITEVFVGLIFGAIVAYGGYEIMAGNTTPGHLVSFLTAFGMAYEPMKKLARLNNTLQIGLGATERIFNVLDTNPMINNKEDAHTLNSGEAEIEFNDVSFSYEGTELKALNGISFKAKKGEVTALVGVSGGGKSTIMSLIPRFYDVIDGSVTINKTDVRDLEIQSLRKSIGLVSQDIIIFNDTIMNNIRYGDPSASDEDVYNAAQAAAADKFISEFEDSYQTVVGENGVKLSGGQKQRISIARAILKNAPILLLDEATSALDNESEKLVQEALRKLEKGRTTIVIAHRLTTVQSADNIIVLESGNIVEEGTHESLLKNEGVYSSMYKTGLQIN